MPVVGVVEHDHVLAAGVCRGEPQREVVGLRARVHEEAHVQRVRERRRQRPRVVDHRSVQVARVRVQLRHLPRAGLDHARVAVADVGDVVDEVEVGAAVGVVEVRAATADDVQRLAIGQRERLAHHDRAARRDVRSRGSRGDAARQSEQQVRVRAEAAPQVGLVAQRHAGQVGDEVREQLQVQVRLPPAIDLPRAQPRDLLARAHLARGQRLRIEMAVQRPEVAVAEHQQAAVVAQPVAVLAPLDDAVERRVDRGARGREQVDRHVARPPAAVRGPELGRGVDRALLVVAADRQAVDRRHRAGQVEHRRGGPVAVHDRHGRRAREDLAHAPGLGRRLVAAGVAEAEVREVGVLARQPLEQPRSRRAG